MNTVVRARKYVANCPAAVSGQGGHDQTFSVATALVHGFCLDFADAISIMTEYNSRCVPPWTEADLQHKIMSAQETPHDKPRGFLLGEDRRQMSRSKNNSAPAVVKPISTEYHLPDEPIQNGAVNLILIAFEKGEGIRIVPAKTVNDEGKEIPTDGPTLSREEWVLKLEARGGNPNRLWSQTGGEGIFIAVNPLKLGGSKDADVTAFRHTLIEFDHISIEEQWNLLLQSNLPCTAVIHSGRRSLHAWVRIDARDRKEYDERVRILYEHFAPYGLDPKNRNPSRLSRLPNCKRFEHRQELIAVGIGVESFIDWLANKESGGLGQEMSIASLLEFDAGKDQHAILGANRWLSKGSSCMIIAQSGVGKSSLAIQMAVLWAVGRAFFGVVPVQRALKSLIIQNENDLGDVSEMLKGVLAGCELENSAETAPLLRQNLVIVRDRIHTGSAFLSNVQRLIEKHQPDLVWVDPLYSFLGDDVNSPKVCAEFLSGGLGPITEASGVCWFFMHHTAKPLSDPKGRKTWTATDFSYLGAGSAVLTNWFRATMTLIKRYENTFELQFGKRGARAGVTDLAGNRSAKRIWLAHAEGGGICWKQVAEPHQPPSQEKKWGRPAVVFSPDAFCQSLASEHIPYGQCVQMICEVADCGERKAKGFFKQLRSRLAYDEEFKTYTYLLPPHPHESNAKAV